MSVLLMMVFLTSLFRIGVTYISRLPPRPPRQHHILSPYRHRLPSQQQQHNNIRRLHRGLVSTSVVTTSDSEDDVETDDSDLDTDDDAAAATTTVLSDMQQTALDLIANGSNVFITGVAGTGKSLVLRQALDKLQATRRREEWVAVAPTGPAAIALEGQTIHSFSGVGYCRERNHFDKAWKKEKQWQELKTMVLDEVSMISGEFFDCLSHVVSQIRGDPRPFGGIQLVVCGDFLQLSPILPRKSEVEQMTTALSEQGQDPSEILFLNRGFCFQARQWKEANFRVVELDRVFRQENQEFVDVLKHIRTGRVTTTVRKFLSQCVRPLPPNKFGVRPTILHSRNRDVERENKLELDKLQGVDEYTYESVDDIQREKGAPKWAENLLRKNQFFENCMGQKELTLKVGAQVMFVKNSLRGRKDSKLTNGSRGTVVGFRKAPTGKALYRLESFDCLLPDVDMYPVVQFINGVKKQIVGHTFESTLVGLGTCTRKALPLRLAWAITTHKSQGLTLDYVIADVGGVFADGQTYVALSRASDESGLELRNFSPYRVKTNKLALAFHQNPSANIRPWDAESPMSKPIITVKSTDAKQLVSSDKDHLRGLVFVFSGRLGSMSRSEATASVETRGASVRTSVSRQTDYLVAGRIGRRTAAYKKAVEILEDQERRSNLEIISEGRFMELLKGETETVPN